MSGCRTRVSCPLRHVGLGCCNVGFRSSWRLARRCRLNQKADPPEQQASEGRLRVEWAPKQAPRVFQAIARTAVAEQFQNLLDLRPQSNAFVGGIAWLSDLIFFATARASSAMARAISVLPRAAKAHAWYVARRALTAVPLLCCSMSKRLVRASP